MSKHPKKQLNSTIQIKLDKLHSIREFCYSKGLIISRTTELLWDAYISGSASIYKS